MGKKVKQGTGIAASPSAAPTEHWAKRDTASGRFKARKADGHPFKGTMRDGSAKKAPHDRFARMLGHAGPGPSTDEIMALTRGDE